MTTELPPGWTEASLRDLATCITKGTTPTSVGLSFTQSGVRFVKVESLREGRIDHRKCSFIDEASHQLLRRSALAPGDVLISIAGTLGRTAVVRTDDIPANTNQAVALVRPLPVLDPRYAALTLEHSAPSFVAEGGRGVGLQNLNLGQIGDLDIPLPPLNEQRRIVAKLEDLLARSRRAKDALDAIPPLLEKLRQSILAAAFRGDLTADWRAKNPDVEPAEELLKRIRIERRKKWEEAELAKLRAKGKAPEDDRWKAKYKEPEPVDASELPELPEGWCWASLDLCSREMTVGHVGPMQNEYVTNGIPFLRSQNVRRHGFDPSALCFISDDFHARLSKSALAPGDLVIVRTGDPGVACVIPESVPIANCSDLVIVRMTGSILPALASTYLNSDFARAHVSSEQVGVAQQHFNVGAARNMPIPVPPPAEQLRILAALSSAEIAIERSTSTVRSAVAAMERLNTSSLAKAFRGELVEQDPHDEPASAMLERLAAERQAAQQAPAAPKRSPRQKVRA